MLLFTRRAERDFEAILAYVRERSPAGARNVARAIDETAKLVAQYPNGGRMSGEDDIRVVRVSRYPYLIYWYVSGRDVWIVHIRHAARQQWHGERE